MDARVSLITLVVDEVEVSRRFYVDGLGWEPELFVPGEVLMIRIGERLLLSLWQREHAERELGPVALGEGAPPVTLAHNLHEEGEVDRVLHEARAAGAATVVAAAHREWGGYSGYFADPDGFRWEVAVNPSPLGDTLLP